MLTESLTTTLSTEVLTYHPEGPPASFEVTVHNTSRTFASFQLELSAAGADVQSAPTWYRVAPEVSSKIPAGARTRFLVDLLAIPPVPSGFTGTMNLNVRVFSLELRNEDRRVLRLVIEGSSRLPPRLVMPNRSFQTYPGNTLEIPLQVQNLNRQAVDVTLTLQGLPLAWLSDGAEKNLHLLAGKEIDVQFVCKLPQPALAPKGSYDIRIEGTQAQTMAVQTEATLTVLPQGHVVLDCAQPKTTLPPTPKRWRNPAVAIATYGLQVRNQSNGNQQVQTEAVYENRREQQRLEAVTNAAPESLEAMATDLAPAPLPAEPDNLDAPENFTAWQPRLAVKPAQCTLEPGEMGALTLTVDRRLPWLGWPRRRRIQVQSALSDPTVDFRQTQPTLALEVFPVIPFWLQIFSSVTGLCLVLLLWWLYANHGHHGAINNLSFSGQGEELLSASDDQSLRRWRVDGREIVGRRQLIRTDKAVRVAQYRPVDNNQIWVGFENGDIKGWDLLLDREYSLSFNRDDRIFDLVLPNQGQTLLSGHGSGQVLAWDISPGQIPLTQSEPLDGINLGFAIQSMALVGNAQSHLVVAGRFNRLVLLNRSGGSSPQVVSNYPSGDGNQYILDMATTANQPNLLVVADNQGRMSLWDVSRCLPTTGANRNSSQVPLSEGSCELIDDWLTGHGGLPVRSVALSTDGCYLVSGGDDGRVMLWPLNSQGRRRSDAQEGQRLQDFRRPVTAVNVLQTPRRILVAYGLENGTVKVRSRAIRASNLPPGECSTRSP